MVSPENPIVGGTTLRIPAIQSPGFITGVTGWAINADGTAEFNGLTLHGTITLGSGGNNVIILDFTRRAIFMYNSVGQLMFSIAPTAGTDALGSAYQIGMTSYLAGDVHSFANLVNGLIQTNISDGTLGFGVQQFAASVASGQQPRVSLTSPLFSGVAAGSQIDLWGQDQAATKLPFIAMGRSDSVALDFRLRGILNFSDPTSFPPTAEAFHLASLNANWTNTGAGFGRAGYRITPLGKIALTGLIQWGAAATPAPDPIFTLPTGYRPDRTINLGAQSSPAPGTNPTTETIQITTAGVVQVTNYSAGPNTPISLEGLEFYLVGLP